MATLDPEQVVTADLLKQFECRVAGDELKLDLELICTRCDSHLCDVEHEDALAVLVATALNHACQEGSPQ